MEKETAEMKLWMEESKEEKVLVAFDHNPLQESKGDTFDAFNLVALLKTYAKQKDLQRGSKVHADILRSGLLEKNVFVGSALVNMYAKCGALEKAQDVFDKLPVRDVILWTVLITSYTQQGQGEEALNCFEQMQHDGFSPDAITYSSILKACGSTGASDKGQKIHAKIIRDGLLERDIPAGTALVDMYAKCGLLRKAQEVFEELQVRDVVLWNALIAGYAQHGHGEEALICFERMQLEGFSPDVGTYACILKACGSIGYLDKGGEIHAEIVKKRLLEKDIMVANSLVDMYGKCGALGKAQELFDGLRVRDVVSWNSLIGGYVQHEHGEKALSCFEQMQLEGFSPNAITFACALRACGSIGAVSKGQEIHTQIAKEPLLERNFGVAIALIDMYAKCGALGKAQEIFDKLRVQDVAAWNALIAGYVQHGHGEEVIKRFKHMQSGGFAPNAATFVWILKACGSTGASDIGQEIHMQALTDQVLEKHILVANALVDMYAKCGLLGKAQEVFDRIVVRDVVLWTVLIGGYAQHGHYEEALNLFTQMQRENFFPDEFTFSCILKACRSLGAANKGQEIHAEIVRDGSLDQDTVVGTALVDLYANCGMLAEAQQVFDKLPVQNLVSWNALMAGYSQLGKAETVFSLFDTMIEGKEPDLITFIVMLNTCSHRGLLDKGQMYFRMMMEGYCIIPTLEHQTCMVDLLCRAGQLDKAAAVIEEMPFSADSTLSHTFLGACQRLGNMRSGRWAFKRAAQLDEKDSAAYVSMSNVYAATGLRGDADDHEAMKRQAWNKQGLCLWTDKSGIIHSLPVEDENHFRSNEIHTRLVQIAHELSQRGSQNNLNDRNDCVHCGHSNILAIACALINTCEGTHIHILRNSRICGDCHSTTSLVSEIEKCRISIRDTNHLHIFEDGKCAFQEDWCNSSTGGQWFT